MDLELKPATADNLKFAWSIYSEFVRQNMFSGRPGRRPASDWHDDKEYKKFADYWNTSPQWIMTVDGKPIGWAAIKKGKQVVSIENWHVVAGWRNKGVSKIILGDLIPKWKREGLRVETDVLAD